MKTLSSFVSGTWQPGTGKAATLYNPTTEEALAETSTAGLDLGAALAFARDKGGPALREMSFAQRGALLKGLAKSIADAREELISLAIANGGNTRSDAKFDIDGASFTLAAYGDLGESLGDKRILADGDTVQVGRTARLSGQHVFTPRLGVAVHINAFNFPAWGLAEKAACSILAGMPVLSKPATATALVAHRMTELFVEQKLLPDGVLSFLCGSAGDVLSHLGPQDVLAFTGSGDTAAVLRKLEAVVQHAVPINVEADSLNAAVLGPDVSPGSETWNLFIRDVSKDMTQKTGQKCTAIRRVFAPSDRLDEAREALAEALGAIKVGDPSQEGTRMGPLANASQHKDVQEGIARLAACTEEGFGGTGEFSLDGKGYFVSPVLRVTQNADEAAIHDREVFGPVATLAAYDGSATRAAELCAKGHGGLVSSVYSDDRAFFGQVIPQLAPYHGRLYLGSEKMAAQSPGPGTVIPHLMHGGPGRAGGGTELGGLRGLGFYQQRTALQGDKSILSSLLV